MPNFKDMQTWTEHLGRTKLRTFTDSDGHFWLEQNPAKPSKWGTFARSGHDVAWEFDGPHGGKPADFWWTARFIPQLKPPKSFFRTVKRNGRVASLTRNGYWPQAKQHLPVTTQPRLEFSCAPRWMLVAKCEDCIFDRFELRMRTAM